MQYSTMDYKEVLKKHPRHAFMHMQEEFMLNVLTATLEETCGNIHAAAELLGISRVTVHNWCKMLAIDTKSERYVKKCELASKHDDILKALAKHGTVSGAARQFGIHRMTLLNWMEKLGIEKP